MRAPTWTGDATGARGREMAGRGGGPWADRRQGKEQEQEQGRRRCHRLPADVGVQAVSGEASGTGGQERPPPHRGLDGLGFEPYKPWKASGASVPGSPFASPSVLVPVSASASASAFLPLHLPLLPLPLPLPLPLGVGLLPALLCVCATDLLQTVVEMGKKCRPWAPSSSCFSREREGNRGGKGGKEKSSLFQ